MMMRWFVILFLGLVLPWVGRAGDECAEVAVEVAAEEQVALPRSASPEGAACYLISPQDGDVVEGPVTVRFGLRGMGVAPAGVQLLNTGHHHLLLNAEELPAMDQPLPSNDVVRHFGGGQTEVTLELEPGTYTMQLLFGDFAHIPHDPPLLSDQITITVK